MPEIQASQGFLAFENSKTASIPKNVYLGYVVTSDQTTTNAKYKKVYDKAWNSGGAGMYFAIRSDGANYGDIIFATNATNGAIIEYTYLGATSTTLRLLSNNGWYHYSINTTQVS